MAKLSPETVSDALRKQRLATGLGRRPAVRRPRRTEASSKEASSKQAQGECEGHAGMTCELKLER
jgi:hypothetical protein